MSRIYSFAKIRKIVGIRDECNYFLIFEAVIRKSRLMKDVKLLAGIIIALLSTQLSIAQTQMWNGQNGGDGTWNATSKNWESIDGSGDGTWQGDTGYFRKTGGTVTLENTNTKPLIFKNLNFFVGGYTLTGGFLGIMNPADNNNGYIIVAKESEVEIASTITNNDAINALFKQGKGKLILSGENTYNGGTHIIEGEVQVSKDKNLGAPISPVIISNATLTVTGDEYKLSDRETFLTEKCTLAISDVSNTLQFTKLFDIKGAFHKDGPGGIIIPIESLMAGTTTILDGTVEFVNNKYDWAGITPVEIKGGTLSLNMGKDNGIKIEDISGNGHILKKGKGTLIIDGSNVSRGLLHQEEGVINLNSNWYGSFEQGNGGASRMNTKAGIYIREESIIRDTICASGLLTFEDDVQLDGATLLLKPDASILIEGNLELDGINTITFEKEPEVPVSLLTVKGNHPTDSETSDKLQVKTGKKLLSNNPDYIFTWYNNELFLRDKNLPFPLQYKVNIKVSPDIEMYDFKEGEYTFIRGESFYFTFKPIDKTWPKEAVSFIVNGEETAFRDLGERYAYSYNIQEIKQNYDIQIGIKSFEIKAPEVKGTTITSASGNFEAIYGEDFTFTVKLDEDYDDSEIKVYANRKLIPPVSTENGSFTYVLESVKETVTLRVDGVIENDPTSNIRTAHEAEYSVSSENGYLIVEMKTPLPIQVYSLTGRLCESLTAGDTQVSIPLTRGIYLVRIGEYVCKAVVK